MNEAAPAIISPEVSSEPEVARVFFVRLDRKDSVDAALNAIMKRASRKGLEGAITWRWGRAFEQVYPCTCEACVMGARQHSPKRVSRIVLVAEGESPKYRGWMFLAALDHMTADDGAALNVLRSVPGAGEPVPAAYRTRGPVCDHCKAKRRRGSTYVVRHDDGRHVQVGSTCIADFLGKDALRVAALAEFLAAVAEACEDDEESYGGGGREESVFRLDDVLVYVAAMMRHAGWMPRSRARDLGSMATADLAMLYRRCVITGSWPRGTEDLRGVEIGDADKERAERAIAWAEALAEDVTEDYLHNVRTIARCNLVTHKTLGIAASIIAACEREDGKRAAAEKRAAAPAYFGTPKKRETFVLTCVGYSSFDTAYGTTHLYRFTDNNGSVAVWKASSVQEIRQGVRYYIKGTVKEHGLYKGMPQTVLTRCSVEGESETQPS